jgi:hypothetical protein
MGTAAFFKILLLTIGLLAIAFVGLAIRMLIKKKGKFINLHLSGNKEMKKRGITCATSTMKKDELNYKAVKIKNKK